MWKHSLGVAHAVEHHLPTATGRVTVVEELIKHAVVHLWGQISHKQRVHLTVTGNTQESPDREHMCGFRVQTQAKLTK